jgi:hypothetical protein
VDARPLLERIARALEVARLDVVLIGNAAAALQGAPVTTVDLDFMFRKTASNLRKLKAVAKALDAAIFMARVDGVRSFAALRARATTVALGTASLRVAELDDIVRSKRAANRPRDRAVLPLLEATLREKARQA